MIWKKINELIIQLVNQHQTNDPFELADIYDIHVSTEWLPSHIRGFFTSIFEYDYIVLNSEQDNHWKTAICAHEIGHAFLHREFGQAFITMNTFFPIDKYEKEANEFAANLLSYCNEPRKGETLEEFANRIGVPIEIMQYKRGILQ